MKKKVLGTAILAAVLTARALTACSGDGKETTVDTTTAPTMAEDTTTAGAEAETTAAEIKAAETVAAGEVKKVIIGAGPAPHTEILNAAREILIPRGCKLDIVEYTDHISSSNALDSGDPDTNYFQHKPYLDSFSKQNDTRLVSAGTIHYEPFGIYTGKTSSLDELEDKVIVLVLDDVSNEVRVLLLLEAQGLIRLKESVGLEATGNNIVENPKSLDIVELEAAQLPRFLPDCNIAAINRDYAIEAGPKMSDAPAAEDFESPAATTYGSIVTVGEDGGATGATKVLVKALTNPRVKQFMGEKYEGTVVPLF